jgi:hypothetical protein
VEEAGFERRSLGALQRAEHAVDAVTRVPIDASHTPLMQRLDEEITHNLGHLELNKIGRCGARRWSLLNSRLTVKRSGSL